MEGLQISTLYREPPIDASYKVSVHLAKRFQRRSFLEIDQSETRIAEISWPNEPKLGMKHLWQILYKDCSFCPGPLANMAHLAKRFQRRRFHRNQPIRNKNCLWWPF
jgi:hypothetical protein